MAYEGSVVPITRGGTGSTTGSAANLTNLPAGQLTGTAPAGVLPLASGGTRGAVIVGSNITNTAGTISLVSGNITSALGFTPLNAAGGTISGNLIVSGDLTVNGTTTTINSTTVATADKLIVLNNATGANDPVPSGSTGIVIDRGSASGVRRNRAGMIWDEGNTRWILTLADPTTDAIVASSEEDLRLGSLVATGTINATGAITAASFSGAGGSITGLDASNISTGTLNVARLSAVVVRTDVASTFTTKITTVATGTGGAGLNLPHGTAPSSPTNGDVWTTTAGLYARINGSTVGPITANTGTVTSVALSVPSILSVSGSPITTSGTLAVSLVNQNANLVFAGPSSGGAAAPTFRSLVAADLPVATASTIGAVKPGEGLSVDGSGVLSVTSGGNRTVRVVTAAGAVTVLTTDDIVVVNKTVGAATAVTLPSSPTTGDSYTIKDGKGDAGTNNITVSPTAGTIDGAANVVMDSNYSGRVFVYNGTEWNVI